LQLPDPEVGIVSSLVDSSARTGASCPRLWTRPCPERRTRIAGRTRQAKCPTRPVGALKFKPDR